MRRLLYKGDITLTRGDNHVYRAAKKGGGSKYIPNVTTIINQKEKSKPLMSWAASMSAKAFDQICPTGMKLHFDEVKKAEAIKAIKNARYTISDTALQIGKIVHDYAERRLRGEDINLPVNDQAKKGCEAFDDWLNDNAVEPEELERPVMSREHWFCGTVDFVGYINGVKTVADFKTSRGIYDEMFMQTSAYKVALEEELGGEIDQRAIIRFDKEGYGAEFHILPNTHQRDFEAFMACKTLFHFDKSASENLKIMRAA